MNVPPITAFEGVVIPDRRRPDDFPEEADIFLGQFPLAEDQFNATGAAIEQIGADVIVALQDAEDAAADAHSSATLAQTAAAALVAVADVTATSTTSLTLGGSATKTFNVGPGKAFAPGMPLRNAVTAAPGNRMDGYVETYNSTTGALQMHVEAFNGAGTFAAWTVTFTGPNFPRSLTGFATKDTGVAIDITLFQLSNSQQAFSARSGINVIMPDPFDLVPGPSQYTLDNYSESPDYSNDVGLKSWAGDLLAYLPPGQSTVCDLNADSTWSFPNAAPVGRPIRYKGPASARIGAANGTFVRLVRLDAYRVLLLLHGVSLHAVVYDKSTNSFGALTLIRAAWATAGGSIDNVVALMTATDQVLVASCPENSTSAQVVVLTTSGTGVTPGTAFTTALGVAAARLSEFIAVGSSYVLGYVTSASVMRMRAHVITGTVVTAGAEVAGAAGTASPVLIPVDATAFAVMSANTSTGITITPYLFSVATVFAAVPANVATTSTNSIVGLTLKQSSLGRWFLTFVNGGTCRVVMLAIAGTVPTFTATLTTASTLAAVTNVQSYVYEFSLSVAVTGTNAAGGFVTEFVAVKDGGAGNPSFVGSLIPVESGAAPTACSLGSDNAGLGGSTSLSWMITTSKGIEVHSFFEATVSFSRVGMTKMRTLAYSSAPAVPAIYPKRNLSKAVLSKFGTRSSATLGDGTLPALYTLTGRDDLGPARHSPRLTGDPLNGAPDRDENSIWLADSFGADGYLILEQVRLA